MGFIVTTVQQLKQWVIQTEHSQEFQESLKTDKLALVHSVHLAHSPIHSLLNYVVYWRSQHSTHSFLNYATHGAVPHSAVHTRCPLHATFCRNTLLSTLAVRYTQHSTVHTRCPLHATLYCPHSLSATHNTLPPTLTVRYTQHSTVHTRCPLKAAPCHAVRHTTVHLLLSAGLTLYIAYRTSRTYFSVPNSAGYS
jgi:hypothetical protein